MFIELVTIHDTKLKINVKKIISIEEKETGNGLLADPEGTKTKIYMEGHKYFVKDSYDEVFVKIDNALNCVEKE